MTTQRRRDRIQLNAVEWIERWTIAGPAGAVSWSVFDRIPGVIRIATGTMHLPVNESDPDQPPERCDVLEGACYPESLSSNTALALAAEWDRTENEGMVWAALESLYQDYFARAAS